MWKTSPSSQVILPPPPRRGEGRRGAGETPGSQPLEAISLWQLRAERHAAHLQPERFQEAAEASACFQSFSGQKTKFEATRLPK